jgi:hypothetical protein
MEVLMTILNFMEKGIMKITKRFFKEGLRIISNKVKAENGKRFRFE